MTPSARTYVVSRGGTRHIVGPPQFRYGLQRINTLCENHLADVAATQHAPLRDCEFCREEQAIIDRDGPLRWLLARHRDRGKQLVITR